MSIDSMTIGDFKAITAALNGPGKPNPFQPGQTYFFRTVTQHIIGTVKETVGDFLVLSDSAWVADSGRFGDAFKGPDELNEVEKTPPGIVGLGSITDAYEYVGVPLETK